VVRDVVWRKVSAEAARTDYGVVLIGSAEAEDLGYDADATVAERSGRGRSSDAFFDRGPGYARLAGGAAYADVDLVRMQSPDGSS
jgi:N-methylhydantoinase B